MDDERFDAWLRVLEEGVSRRGVLGILGGLGLLAAAPGIAGAKKSKRRNRKGNRASSADRVSAASKPDTGGQGRYQTLAAKWWTWAIDEDLVPIIESGTVDCSAGQQGNTWFLVPIQVRSFDMRYPAVYASPAVRASADRGGAAGPGGRSALRGRLHPAPLPDHPGQRPR